MDAPEPLHQPRTMSGRLSTRRSPAIGLLLVSLLLAPLAVLGCGGGNGDDRQAPTHTDERGQESLAFERVDTVARGLEVPWGLAFVDEQTILVTERPGRVRVVENGELRAEPAAEFDVLDTGEAGLLGIALHPDFPETRLAYVYYTTPEDNRVSRFRVGDDLRFVDEEVIVDGIPAAAVHDGGAIAFGPDGMLYVATGDAGEPSNAADRASLGGKILRVRADGGIPSDNPFPDSLVFSYGHRNPQGLDWDGDGRLYAAEHGPTGEFGLCCGDEVNLVESGAFYGWPFVAGGMRTQEGDPPQEPVEPLATSGEETWAPAGLAVHRPQQGPTSLFVANLAGEQLLRILLDDARSVESREVALDGLGRLRAAAFGPDGCLYLTTSNTDGRGRPSEGDDRLLAVCPRR